jgi:hypothetical protein
MNLKSHLVILPFFYLLCAKDGAALASVPTGRADTADSTTRIAAAIARARAARKDVLLEQYHILSLMTPALRASKLANSRAWCAEMLSTSLVLQLPFRCMAATLTVLVLAKMQYNCLDTQQAGWTLAIEFIQLCVIR